MTPESLQRYLAASAIVDVDHPEVAATARRLAEGAASEAAGAPVRLVALQAPCVMRKTATDALDRAGIPWRVVYTSPSLAGVWAAVAAGLGVTVRTRLGLPADVCPLGPDAGAGMRAHALAHP